MGRHSMWDLCHTGLSRILRSQGSCSSQSSPLPCTFAISSSSEKSFLLPYQTRFKMKSQAWWISSPSEYQTIAQQRLPAQMHRISVLLHPRARRLVFNNRNPKLRIASCFHRSLLSLQALQHNTFHHNQPVSKASNRALRHNLQASNSNRRASSKTRKQPDFKAPGPQCLPCRLDMGPIFPLRRRVCSHRCL